MRYQIGDKVMVRKDLVIDQKYYMEDYNIYNTFVDDMAKLCGQIVTIDEIRNQQYRIKEDRYNWVDQMFTDPVTVQVSGDDLNDFL